MVPIIRLCAGSLGLIQIAGSSVSPVSEAVSVAGRIYFSENVDRKTVRIMRRIRIT